jgi:thioredoxin 1
MNSWFTSRTTRNLNSVLRNRFFYNFDPELNLYTMALEATDSNFEEIVLKADKPVIVDFWAEWCGPCRMVGPIVEEVGVEYDGKAVVAKVDVDSNPGITAKYGIRNIPTILFFKNGEVADKQVGAVPKSTIVSKLEPLL